MRKPLLKRPAGRLTTPASIQTPKLGFEYDTAETVGGYPGGYFDQLIKTGGKLALQQAAALMDVLNAKLALRRAKSDLRYQVRGFYFAVLVAQENARASEALYRFAEEIYRVQVSLLQGGFAAAYEPMQLRPLVLQAQLNTIQAATSLGRPGGNLRPPSVCLACRPPSWKERQLCPCRCFNMRRWKVGSRTIPTC